MSMDENKQNVPSFIGKLAMMLEDHTAAPYVAWSGTGDSIIVINPSLFATQVLPRYFKHSNFASFVRQLNLYGFHKTSQEPETCEFAHPMFRQGNEHLFKDIKRKVASGSGFDKDPIRQKCETDRLMAEFQDLKAKHKELEAALQQKEAEKQLIFTEMMQSKQRQEVLEQRLTKMLEVLMKACQSIGIASIDNDKSMQQILDGSENPMRFKRARLMVDNKAANDASPTLPRPNDYSQTDEWLESLMASVSKQNASTGRETLRITNLQSPAYEKPTLLEIEDGPLPVEPIEDPDKLVDEVVSNTALPTVGSTMVSSGSLDKLLTAGTPIGTDSLNIKSDRLDSMMLFSPGVEHEGCLSSSKYEEIDESAHSDNPVSIKAEPTNNDPAHSSGILESLDEPPSIEGRLDSQTLDLDALLGQSPSVGPTLERNISGMSDISVSCSMLDSGRATVSALSSSSASGRAKVG